MRTILCRKYRSTVRTSTKWKKMTYLFFHSLRGSPGSVSLQDGASVSSSQGSDEYEPTCSSLPWSWEDSPPGSYLAECFRYSWAACQWFSPQGTSQHGSRLPRQEQARAREDKENDLRKAQEPVIDIWLRLESEDTKWVKIFELDS